MASFSFSGGGSGGGDSGGGVFGFWQNAAVAAPAAQAALQGGGGNKFKLILVGDGGVGKTALVHKLLTGSFKHEYVATLGVEVRCLDFHTNRGVLKFNCWDTAGQEKFGGLRDGYYIKGQCAIIIFDMTSRITYKHVPNWHRDIMRVCDFKPGQPDHNGLEFTPVILVGNKCESSYGSVRAKQVTFHRKKGIQFIEMSVKTEKNIEEPFLQLCKHFANDQSLELTFSPQEITRKHMISGRWQDALNSLPNDPTELNIFLAKPAKFGRLLMQEVIREHPNNRSICSWVPKSLNVLKYILDRCPNQYIPGIASFLSRNVSLEGIVSLFVRRTQHSAEFLQNIIYTVQTENLAKHNGCIFCNGKLTRGTTKCFRLDDHSLIRKAFRFIDHHAFVEFCCVSSLYHTPDVLNIIKWYLQDGTDKVCGTYM